VTTRSVRRYQKRWPVVMAGQSAMEVGA
jgi:hypothetical protein